MLNRTHMKHSLTAIKHYILTFSRVAYLTKKDTQQKKSHFSGRRNTLGTRKMPLVAIEEYIRSKQGWQNLKGRLGAIGISYDYRCFRKRDSQNRWCMFLARNSLILGARQISGITLFYYYTLYQSDHISVLLLLLVLLLGILLSQQ